MEILILSILILFNGFFALSETSLISSKRARLEQLRSKGSKGAETALKLLDNSENFLSAVQVGITFIGILTGVYGGIRIADDFSPFLEKIDFLEEYASEIALTITVVLITFFSIVFGELVPKTIALRNPEKIAERISPVIEQFSRVFHPFVLLLSVSTSLVNKVLGIGKSKEQLSGAELRQMIRAASIEGIIEKNQNVIHEKVFYFSDKKAKHIMTHRTDIEWIDIDKPDEELKRELFKVQHSKILCCRGELDNLEAVLYVRDFYKAIITSGDSFKITDLLVDPVIVIENTDAQNILDFFRQKNTQICCVVNEYGGMEGVITLHDIIENIVGHIPDEEEKYEPEFFIREDNSVLVSGDAPVESLSEIIPNFTIDFEKIDYSTVAGFVLNQINDLPRVGDKFDYMGYKIEIVDMDDKRIDKILIYKK